MESQFDFHAHYPFYLLVSFAVVFVIAVSTNFTSVRRFITGDAIPGIPRLRGNPVFGSLFEFMTSSITDMVDKLIEIAGEDGVAYFWAGPSIVVQLNDLQLVKDLLSKPDHLASRETKGVWTPFATFHHVLGGDTPFNYTGKKSREARRHLHAAYASPKALSQLLNFVVPFADKHVKRLAASASNDTNTGLRQYVEHYTSDLWANLFYGIEEGHVEFMAIVPALDTLFNEFSSPKANMKHAIWSFIKHLGYGCTPNHKVTRQFQTLLRDRLNFMLSTDRPSASYLWKFSVEKNDANPGGLSDLALDLARLNIIGGVQGFRQIIPCVILELSRHPDRYEKVHQELKDLYPSGNASDISLELFQNQTPYLDAVINEVLRLYPPVHLTARATRKDITMTTPTGKHFTISPSTMVYFSIYHIHTSEDLWGPDAKTFNPERFLKSKESGEHLEGKFMPFGYGPRSCPGFKFAPLIIKTYLVVLLRSYRLDLHDFGTDITRTGPLLESANNKSTFTFRRLVDEGTCVN